MNRTRAYHHADFDMRRVSGVDEARDAFAVIKEVRELRALACKLAARAYWRLAEYCVSKNVRSEEQPTLSS